MTMRISRETTTGWVSSLMLHGALLLIFFLVSIPEVVENQDFIEVSWGSPAVSTPSPQTLTEPDPRRAEVSPSVTVNEKKTESKKPSRPVFLPERRMANPVEEVLATPRSEKLLTSETGTTSGTVERGGVGEREARTGTSLGDRDQRRSADQAPDGRPSGRFSEICSACPKGEYSNGRCRNKRSAVLEI